MAAHHHHRTHDKAGGCHFAELAFLTRLRPPAPKGTAGSGVDLPLSLVSAYGGQGLAVTALLRSLCVDISAENAQRYPPEEEISAVVAEAKLSLCAGANVSAAEHCVPPALGGERHTRAAPEGTAGNDKLMHEHCALEVGRGSGREACIVGCLLSKRAGVEVADVRQSVHGALAAACPDDDMVAVHVCAADPTVVVGALHLCNAVGIGDCE
mmetsp:Transcript_20347/g.77902  ORF Transcript_20347/g.77902 Transcript_20347/m.77902 type:complete len:211 (-) Transcript_20347:624-1256(-)